MRYIKQIGIILLITVLGELLRGFIPLPIPAGIYGFVILFICLCTGVIKLKAVDDASSFLVDNLQVFLLPACVEIVNYWGDIKQSFAPVLLIAGVSTLVVIVVTGKVSDFIISRKEGRS